MATKKLILPTKNHHSGKAPANKGKKRAIGKTGGGVKSVLTPRVLRFIQEYLIDLNGSRAAVTAGYSKATAKSTASELLKKPEIAAMVQSAMDERARRTQITADQVLINISRLSMKAEASGEFAPAIRAEELLGKHLKLFGDKLTLQNPDGSPLAPATIVPVFNITLTDE